MRITFCNLDEIGIKEREDRPWKKLIVPTTIRGQITFHGIHRKLKLISIAVCISTAGEHVTPLSFCSQTNTTAERILRTEGFGLGIDLILRQRSKPRMTSELFNEDI
jgi:hypothetical protein